jgi:hypothetical protein
MHKYFKWLSLFIALTLALPPLQAVAAVDSAEHGSPCHESGHDKHSASKNTTDDTAHQSCCDDGRMCSACAVVAIPHNSQPPVMLTVSAASMGYLQQFTEHPPFLPYRPPRGHV